MKKHHWVLIVGIVVAAYLLLTGTLQSWLSRLFSGKKRSAAVA
jgi:hypothetical protein